MGGISQRPWESNRNGDGFRRKVISAEI
jgi:hypothetical protein